MIVIIDMETGNLQSVMSGFRRIGLDVRVASSPEDVDRAGAVILPGVGAFADGMDRLREKGLIEPLRRHALERARPLLGICLGMQLLADRGVEHGAHEGLGIIPGSVCRLTPNGPGCLVPNMGWNDTFPRKACLLFPAGTAPTSFYFAHSYHFVCENDGDVAATIDYGGVEVTAAIERRNIFGVQFHPEKSQDAGLDVLNRLKPVMSRRPNEPQTGR